MTVEGSPRRERGRRLKVAVTEAERAQIEASAAAANLSVSAYLRVLGLGYEPKSVIDQRAVLDLVRTAGDLGRVGGLLKLWLMDRPGEGVAADDVRVTLNEIIELQHELRLTARRL